MNLHKPFIIVDFEDLNNFDEKLASKLRMKPDLVHPLLERAAAEVLSTLQIQQEGKEEYETI